MLRVRHLVPWQAAERLLTGGAAAGWWRLLQEPRAREGHGLLTERCSMEPVLDACAVVHRILRVLARCGPVRHTDTGKESRRDAGRMLCKC